jgi:diguanylate cyclase (GGDEF)-like protein
LLQSIEAMRIALVDANTTAQELTARVLEARAHEVLCFADGALALERVRTDTDIDAVITNTEVPPTSGMDICWEARLLASRSRSIYILLMASPDDKTTLIEALDCGADDVIDRPPIPEELYAKLRSAERFITLQRELIRMATRDPLTGAYNRRAFFEDATEAWQEATRECPLSVILLDIDRFKAINDHYGHGIGDDVLRAVAREAAQDGTVVGRLGGDEFAILLRASALSGAVEAAEDLRRRLAQLRIRSEDGMVRLTCSLGTGELEPGDSIDDLMKRADLALYRAKEDGRDRVATPPTGSWLGQRPRQAVSLVRSIARQPQGTRAKRERRNGSPPSDALLARSSAVVDLLVDSGLSEEGAAQLMVDRMVSAGVFVPKTGAARWKDLLAWRADLLNGAAWEDALREYEKFAALIEAIPPHERVDRVLQEELWDQRRVPAQLTSRI